MVILLVVSQRGRRRGQGGGHADPRAAHALQRAKVSLTLSAARSLSVLIALLHGRGYDWEEGATPVRQGALCSLLRIRARLQLARVAVLRADTMVFMADNLVRALKVPA